MTTFAVRVKRGRSLVEREAKGIREVAALRFQIGDEILAVREEAEYGDGTVEKYAQEIGLGYDSARWFAVVAEAFPEKSDRSHSSPREFNASYSVFRELASRDDRFKVIAKLKRRKPDGRYWTVDEVRIEVGKEPTRKTSFVTREEITNLSSEEKTRMVQQIAKESPQAMRDAMDDLAVRAEASHGIVDWHKKADVEREKQDSKRPGYTQDAEVNAEVALFNAQNHIRTALTELSKIEPTAEAKVPLLRLANSIRERLDLLISFLEDGAEFDDVALAEMLREG